MNNFDNYHKPIYSFSYLHYPGRHPQHTKNILFCHWKNESSVQFQRIRKSKLNKLKFYLIWSPRRGPRLNNRQNESTEYITYVPNYNAKTKFDKSIINNSLNDFYENSLKTAFVNKSQLPATRQAKSLQSLLTRARFNVVPKPIASPKNVELYN